MVIRNGLLNIHFHISTNFNPCFVSSLFSCGWVPSGRGRPPRSLRRSRRPERDSKDTSKLLLLYDDHILDNDPLRESKDIAFAQAYLNRVRNKN